jgi:hypothetical protein
VVKTVTVVPAPAPAGAQRAPGFLVRNRAVVLFVLLLLVGDFGVGLLAPVWERHSPDDYTARLTGCAERPRDLVFVGGSPVAEDIDPEVIAGVVWRGRPLADVYALGLPGGTASDVYYATIRACPTPPRVLVYGATASDLNDDRNEPHGTSALLSPGDAVELMEMRPDAAWWVIRHYLEGKLTKAANIYRYRHGIRMWAALQADGLFPGSCPDAVRQAIEQRDHADDLAGGSGYAPYRLYAGVTYEQIKAAGKPAPPFSFLTQFRTGSHLKYVYKLADWCRANGVELVVVDMPATVDLEVRYAPEFAEYRTRLAAVERASGVIVIRDTRACGLTDEQFADLIHLTPAGCRKFSAWLRGKLEEVGR